MRTMRGLPTNALYPNHWWSDNACAFFYIFLSNNAVWHRARGVGGRAIHQATSNQTQIRYHLAHISTRTHTYSKLFHTTTTSDYPKSLLLPYRYTERYSTHISSALIPLHSNHAATHNFFRLEARHSLNKTSDPMRLLCGYNNDVFFICVGYFAIISVR